MSTKLGVSLIAIGLGLKGIRRGFKFIKKRQYIDPQRMYPGGFYATMNRREAQLILGVSQGAQSSLIKVRHRTLMLMNHPDNGGSTFIATKINQAKELLISE